MTTGYSRFQGKEQMCEYHHHHLHLPNLVLETAQMLNASLVPSTTTQSCVLAYHYVPKYNYRFILIINPNDPYISG